MFDLLDDGPIVLMVLPDIFNPLPIVNIIESVLILVDHVHNASNLKELIVDHSFGSIRRQIGNTPGELLKLLKLFTIVIHLFIVIIVFNIFMQLSPQLLSLLTILSPLLLDFLSGHPEVLGSLPIGSLHHFADDFFVVEVGWEVLLDSLCDRDISPLAVHIVRISFLVELYQGISAEVVFVF